MKKVFVISMVRTRKPTKEGTFMPIDDNQPTHIWDQASIHDIQEKARLGRYRIRAFATARPLPTLEDLTFLPAGLTRVPLEGYRESCNTEVLLGTRYAKKPLRLSMPITIAGMSYGALSRNAKEALGLGASRAGTSTCTGDGGMHPVDREYSKTLVYQCLPSRYGFNPCDVMRADAIEIVVGQGAKPGTGGLLLGQKVSPEIARMRDLLAAGLDGIARDMKVDDGRHGNLYSLSAAEARAQGIDLAPANLGEALDALEQDTVLCEALGTDYTKCYLEAKRNEWHEYEDMLASSVSNWELKRYLGV